MAGVVVTLPNSTIGGIQNVASVGDLPASATFGDIYLVTDTGELYWYDGDSWEPVNAAVGTVDINGDTTGTLNANRGGTGSANNFAGNLFLSTAAGANGGTATESVYGPTDVAGLLTDVSQLQTDVSDLQADVTQLQTDVNDLENEKVDKVDPSTDNALVRFDGIAGAQKNSGVILNDQNDLSGARSMSFAGGSNSFFRVPLLTTVQRDALTPQLGMIIYNTDNNLFEGYFTPQPSGVSAWGALHGWGS